MFLAILLTEEGFKLTDWLIVIFTLALALVAYKQYLLGKSQDEHFENSERAWILLSMTWIPQFMGVMVSESRDSTTGEIVGRTFINVKLAMRNEGKSPAFIDEIKARVIVGWKFSEVDLPAESEFRGSGWYVQPIGAGKDDFVRLELSHPAKIRHEEFFSIHVRVEYHDIFGVKRLSTTAYVLDSTGTNLNKQEAFRSWHLNT